MVILRDRKCDDDITDPTGLDKTKPFFHLLAEGCFRSEAVNAAWLFDSRSGNFACGGRCPD
jgi:hypothetical protein